MTTTGPRHVDDGPRSTLDLPFETAAARIAALHQETRRHRVAADSGAGPLHWTRQRIGRAFIALGSAIAPSAVSAPGTARGRTPATR